MSNLYEIFLRSVLTEEGSFITSADVISWLNHRNDCVKVEIEIVKFEQMDSWIFDDDKGVLRHNSGKFFSIQGIDVKTNWGAIDNWQQPIINQPEIGYLGIITKEFNGVLHFLLQAKIEPGNINHVQLSPTLQATKSNYCRVHKGKVPQYLEYFVNVSKENILLDQLQSEQGARFLKKRNRNIIIKINDEIDVKEDFVWLTLGQIKKLIRSSNIINMDTRTVISGIPFGDFQKDSIDLFFSLCMNKTENVFKLEMLRSALIDAPGVNSYTQIFNWITKLKTKYELNVSTISLKKINDWIITEENIHHKENLYFKIIGANIKIGNREVSSWSQPLVQPFQSGLICFILKRINGVYHFLVQAKVECGNFDIIELAPTVQCLTGSYKGVTNLPYLRYILNANQNQIVFDTMQSEEGGRFFREQNRNLIIIANDDLSVETPENFIWMTLNQLLTFIKFNNYINIQARSLISAINFI